MLKKALEYYGWTICTIHPLEISHDDVSFARGVPANIFAEYLQKCYEEEHINE
jgi:hypothetical protein